MGNPGEHLQTLFPGDFHAGYTPRVALSAEELSGQLVAALGVLQTELRQLPALRDSQLDQLTGYLLLIAQYNKAAQLTGLRRPSLMAAELAAESLRLLAVSPAEAGAQLLDLGSGNGSPVIPLAIACPDIDCHACEVRERRVAFLRLCAVHLKLPNLQVLDTPVENVLRGGGRWDIVTSRAFAPPQRLLPLAARLLGGRGELRGFLGAEAAELQELAPLHGFRVATLEAYRPGEHPRHVYRLVQASAA